MKKIEYKGYIISQAENNHIMITKDENMIFHANITKKLTTDELKNQVEWFIKMQNLIDTDEVSDEENM